MAFYCFVVVSLFCLFVFICLCSFLDCFFLFVVFGLVLLVLPHAFV